MSEEIDDMWGKHAVDKTYLTFDTNENYEPLEILKRERECKLPSIRNAEGDITNSTGIKNIRSHNNTFMLMIWKHR